jgi:hypothetical protein
MARTNDEQLSLPGLGPDDDEQLAAMRSEVTGRMRREWAELDPIRRAGANIVARALQEQDPRLSVERWKAAKLASETLLLIMRTLAVKQQGEHAACGLGNGSDDVTDAGRVVFYLPENGR